MCPIRYRALVQVFGMKSSVSKSPDWCRTWKSHAVTRTTKSDYRTYGFGTIPVVRLPRLSGLTQLRSYNRPASDFFLELPKLCLPHSGHTRPTPQSHYHPTGQPRKPPREPP